MKLVNRRTETNQKTNQKKKKKPIVCACVCVCLFVSRIWRYGWPNGYIIATTSAVGFYCVPCVYVCWWLFCWFFLCATTTRNSIFFLFRSTFLWSRTGPSTSAIVRIKSIACVQNNTTSKCRRTCHVNEFVMFLWIVFFLFPELHILEV